MSAQSAKDAILQRQREFSKHRELQQHRINSTNAGDASSTTSTNSISKTPYLDQLDNGFGGSPFSVLSKFDVCILLFALIVLVVVLETQHNLDIVGSAWNNVLKPDYDEHLLHNTDGASSSWFPWVSTWFQSSDEL